MSRFNPARMSVKSRGSSNRIENDLSSLNENEVVIDEHAINTLSIRSNANHVEPFIANSPFARRNSSRFGGANGGSFASRRSSTKLNPSNNNNSIGSTTNESSASSSNNQVSSAGGGGGEIHIAPLPSFFDDDFAPTIENLVNSHRYGGTTTEKSKKEVAPHQEEKKPEQAISIDDIFVKNPRKFSLGGGSEIANVLNTTAVASPILKDSPGTRKKSNAPLPPSSSNATVVNSTPIISKTVEPPVKDQDSGASNETTDEIDFSYFDLFKKEHPETTATDQHTPESPVATKAVSLDHFDLFNGHTNAISNVMSLVPPPTPQLHAPVVSSLNPFENDDDEQNEDEEDQIDWVSSDDEDIIKKVEKEVEGFGRNNVNTIILALKLNFFLYTNQIAILL
jgi:hypothetical protein